MCGGSTLNIPAQPHSIMGAAGAIWASADKSDFSVPNSKTHLFKLVYIAPCMVWAFMNIAGWSIRFNTTFCWHQIESRTLVYEAYTVTELSFWCPQKVASNLMEHPVEGRKWYCNGTFWPLCKSYEIRIGLLLFLARKEDIICCNCHQVSINQYANEQSEEIMRFYSADE